jgi:hypothetical protein
MLPTPNLSQIAHQTQEFAKHSKDQRLGLVFQTVSMVSMAVLGVGAAVHLLREMLRNPHHRHHDSQHPNYQSLPQDSYPHGEHRKTEGQDSVDEHRHRHHVSRRASHGQHRG